MKGGVPGARLVFSGLGVGGDFFGYAGFVSGEHDAESVGDSLVPLGAAGEGDSVVDGLAIELVGENIEGGAVSIGQVVVSGEGEQTDAADEGGVGLFRISERAVEGGGGGPGGKDGSGDAAGFEEAEIVVCEAVKLEMDGGGEIVGNSDLNFVDGLAEGHLSVLRAEDALGAEVVEDGGHVEGVSGGVLVDEAGKPDGKLFRDQLAAQVF